MVLKSEYFAQNKEMAFPGTKELSTTYNDMNDGFEDLEVQMTEMHDNDNGDDFMMQTDKLQLQTVPSISSAINTLDSTRITPQHQGGWIRGARMNGNLGKRFCWRRHFYMCMPFFFFFWLPFNLSDCFRLAGSGGSPQRVPVKSTQRGTTIPISVRGPSRANGTGSGERDKDPTKVVSGGIRLRSIHYATSVQQILDGSISMDPQAMVDDEHKATVVLAEVIGKQSAWGSSLFPALPHEEKKSNAQNVITPSSHHTGSATT